MKKIINAVKRVINANRRIAECESWAKYLESEVAYLNRKSVQDNISIAELVRENELISGANTRLIKEIAAVRNIANQVRDRQLSTAATPAEHEFLRVCTAIYDSGKVIKGRRFAAMMGAALKERRSAIKGRFGGGNGIGELWECRSGAKGN
ncbi:hypothetical protein [Citrobacter sp. Marseille-Q6884]|uniref:hypothetical protein n=1 Tax=Citrobacter sp. Marseille-Q6884 TaxID=2956786 RepID=UPI0021B29878|nr:hypothetical protein [Citrobacter sp. Marseille-Q6884]